MSPAISSSTASQDSSTTLHDAIEAESTSNSPSKSLGVVGESALPKDDGSGAIVESSAVAASAGDLPASRPTCKCTIPADIEQAGNTCNGQCIENNTNITTVAEKELQVTDEERQKAPPFCEMQKVISGKGEQLIYVGWNGPDDPANPRNWSHKKKWIITSVGCLFCSIVSLSFSAYSIAINDIEERLDTSYLLSVAGVSLFTLTFGVAPLLLAPLSEIWGRRPAYVGSAVIYTLFQLPQALATNIETMLVSRFIAGIGGSTAVAVLGGTLADLFSNEERGIPMAIFATVAFGSTSVAPALFGYLVQFRGFRPVMWIQFALSGATVILLFFLAKETRAEVLLSRKAKKLRLETGDKRFATQAEEERASITTILKVALTRPFHLLFTEPIIQAFTTLLSFVYAVLYLLLVAIPIVYARVYQFNTGQVGLVYLSQAAGTVIGTGVTIWTNKLYHENVAKRGAEARLYSGMVGGACLPVGSWIFAWGSMPSVHWIVPTIGIAIIYCGIFLIYTTCFNFLADSYTLYASSALSILNVWRNLLGAAFPLFCADLYNSLGVQGAGSLVAGLSTLVSIIPFIGFHYGARLRANSRYAKEMAAREAKGIL